MAYSATIIISAGKVASDLTNFVSRVNLADMPAAWWVDVASDGGNIRVRQGGSDLPFDLVAIDKPAKTGELFFKANLASATSNTFTVNTVDGATAPAVTDIIGRNAVWSDYDAVFMFQSLVNRTGSGTDAVLEGTGVLANGWLNTNARTGNARVSGVPQRSTWIVGASIDQLGSSGNRSILSYSFNTGGDGARASLVTNGSSYYGAWNSANGWLSSGLAPNSSRHRLHMAHDAAVTRKIYVDGTVRASGASSVRPGAPGDVLFIGAEDTSYAERFAGLINYVYLRNGTLSDDWLAAEQASWEGSGFYLSSGPVIGQTLPYDANGNELHVRVVLTSAFEENYSLTVTGTFTQTFNFSGGTKVADISFSGLTAGQAYSIDITPSNSIGTGGNVTVSGTFSGTSYIGEVMQDAPAVYHPMQETAGRVAVDYGVSGKNGTYAGGVTLADTVDPGSLRPFGDHVRLDASTGHVVLEDTSWFTPASGFTFEGMFYFRSWSNWMRIFDFANAASSDDMYFAANSSGTMQLRINGAQFTFPRFDLNKWIHLAVTVTSAGAAVVYVDGTIYASGTVGAPVNAPRAFKYIGKSAYSDPYLAASVAHVSVYNSVLAQARIQAHAAQIATRAQDLMVLGYMYTYVNVGIGYLAPNQNGYFLAEVNLGQNSPPARTAFIEADAYVIARRFIGWGVPTAKL